MKLLPVIDMTAYVAVMDKLDGEPSKLKEQLGPELTESCKQLAQVLSEAGAVVVKDPRCSAEENKQFIEMMERYYESPVEYKRPQERPSLRYQVWLGLVLWGTKIQIFPPIILSNYQKIKKILYYCSIWIQLI